MSQAALNISRNRYNKKNFFLWQKEKAYHFAGILFLISVLSITLISCWMVLVWMKNNECLLLSKLVITGEHYYTSNDDIRQSILALNSSKTFMTQNVNLIQKQIKCLPWIKNVGVRKQWPNKLKIHLVEYVPIAYWNNRYMIDIEGRSFSIPNNRADRQNLPDLYSSEDNNKEVLQLFCKIKQILSKNCLMLKNAAITMHHSWQLTLTNGIKLNLGRSDIIKRLLRFIELYPVLQQQAQMYGKQINYVDLRYDSGAAVGWGLIPVKKFNQQ